MSLLIEKVHVVLMYWLCIALIVVILFSPIYVGDYVYQPSSSQNMNFLIQSPSVNFYMACSACVAVSVPLFFDFIFDLIDGHKSIDSCERFLIAVCISLPRLFYIFYPNNNYKLYYGLSIQTTFDVLKVFMNLSVACKLCPDLMPLSRMATIFLIYFASMTMSQYDSLTKSYMTVPGLSDVLWYLAFGLYVFQTGYFIWAGNKKLRTKGKSSYRTRYYISLSHLMMPLCLGFAACVLQIQFYGSTWLSANEHFFTVYFLIDTMITIILTILPGRLARNETIETNHILDTKRTFVRYVSHEIRSPLNVVVAGLNIIQRLLNSNKSILKKITDDDMKRLISEFQSNVIDIHTSSLVAIEILNDLLNYEKIDAGLFEVKLHLVPSFNIFETNLSSFFSFAQSKEIHVKVLDESQLISSPFDMSFQNLSCVTLADLPGIKSSQDQYTYMLNVDPHCIDIVMRNLMTNAVKFTPAGGTITIKVYIAHGDLSDTNPLKEHLCVEVTDTGAGIDECNLGHLFGEFEQFDNRKLQGGGGSGLGLWICRNIINQHGGKIGAMSGGSGQGSTFYFQLPIVKKELSQSRNEPAELKQAESKAIEMTRVDSDSGVRNLSQKLSPSLSAIGKSLRARGSSYIQLDGDEANRSRTSSKDGLLSPFQYWHSIQRICFMVVDDSKINRKILIRLLQSEIAAKSPDIILDFIEAEDGDVAVEKLRSSMAVNVSGSDAVSRGSVDCILIDNIMVNMNGPEAVKAIREKLNYSGLIIGITGNALREDLEYFESCGCNKALSKPVDINLLLRLLEGGEVGRSPTREVSTAEDMV